LLKIENLLITKEGKVTNICHNDVRLSCQKEELALLGKLFTLINSRVIKDEYEERLYLPFIDIVKDFKQGRMDLATTLSRIVTLRSHPP
jgi:hypothetical protein